MSAEAPDIGAIVELLREENVFAQRIRAKLSEDRPLLGDQKAKLGQVLVEHHCVDERRLTEILAAQLGFEIVDPQPKDLHKKLLAHTNSRWMTQNEFVPIRSENGAVDETDRDTSSDTSGIQRTIR